MSPLFNGKRILIVGGNSGIGLAVAKQLHQNGAHVLIASRKAAAQSKMLAEELGITVEAYSLDITSEQEQNHLFELVGNIDHLVITVRPDIKPSAFIDVEINEAKRAFDTKFWGQYRLIQKAQCFMNSPGSITMTSGIAGERIYKGSSIMSIINSATETLCRVLAVELAPLRVNVVSPGFIEPKPQATQEYAKTFPAQRLAVIDEVVSTYLHLMISSYITGTVAVVDGGARLI
jgi:NAD(P)-dependent dehydrogenase (short-subunit alcohol dehydrogenase family)